MPESEAAFRDYYAFKKKYNVREWAWHGRVRIYIGFETANEKELNALVAEFLALRARMLRAHHRDITI
ncbi:MAG: hypothetical protein LBJ18_02760 [Rickettsiales bacterium]|jgi:hypothetical protein|nr:hypothetical protein [Rickettsiales bacterium]